MSEWVTGLDVAAMIPFSIACGFAILVLFFEVFQRQSYSRGYLSYVTAVGCVVTGLAAAYLLRVNGYSTWSGTAYLDGYTQVFTMAFCLAGGVAALLAPRYLADNGVDRGEFYALILFAVAGMIGMVAAADLVVFFVTLEIMSVASYALTAYLRRSAKSAEAGVKYFILGAMASAILLFGIALVFGATGSTSLEAIGAALPGGAGASSDAVALAERSRDAILLAASGYAPTRDLMLTPLHGGAPVVPMVSIGIVLIVAGFAFKVAAVPFHMWAPDVYQGAPTPVVGFMATAVKAAGFAALARVLGIAFSSPEVRMGHWGWMQVLFVIALLSMVVGNLAAITQRSVKRMLAYSSIAHAGYMLVALVAMGYTGDVEMASGLALYAFVYTFATVGAFGVLAYIGKRGADTDDLDDLNGLGAKHPWLGAAMTVFMLSSAGIPPAAGFVGKLQLFRQAIEASQEGEALGQPGAHLLIVLVVVGILASVAGVFYYLNVLVHLLMMKPRRVIEVTHDGRARWAIAICAALTLWFGIAPSRLVDLAQRAVEQMEGRPDGVYVDWESRDTVGLEVNTAE